MMRGQKWLLESKSLSPQDKTKVLQRVSQLRQELVGRKYPTSTLGVRPPSYTGEPHPIAAITIGPGGCELVEVVFRNAG